MSMRQRLHRFLTSPRLTYWNAGLCAAAIAGNIIFQVFCRPVLWATITLVVAFVPVILYPLLRSTFDRWQTYVHFLFGIAACICIYCILFLGQVTLLTPLLMFINPFAILAWLPCFLLIQIIYHVAATAGSFRPFLTGVVLCLVFAAGMAIWFHRSYPVVRQALADPGMSSNVPPNYMTELMLGMHIKYHTSFCAYDGWRPPLHDPSIVVAAWLNVHKDTYRRNRGDIVCPATFFVRGDRIAVYQSVFPKRSLWQSCSCAIMYSWSYHEDAERMNWRQYEQYRALPE